MARDRRNSPAPRGDRVRTDTGELGLVAMRSLDSVARAEVLLVPGGGRRGTTATMANTAVLDWIRRIHRGSTWTTSVCTGSLILGAAGLLRGLPATTYWASRPYLADEGAVYTPGRFVEAGKVITAAGVSAGIDGSPEKAGPELQQLALKLLADSAR
ncbi:DJ-1/PfpI family protein [Streptomyces sp. NPDC005970]|uniref:DJ-1/PfpI family protein n=1 Tax=Streptomyces sp. NPDC005970 TaxID=3156723 RepID=UPI0033CE82E3